MVLIMAGWVSADVNVSIPNTQGDTGQSISIPVNVSQITAEDSVIAYQFVVTFDENVLDATGVTRTGTLSDESDWSVIPNTNVDGQITIGGYGAVNYIVGSGALIKIDFDIVGDPTETTNLNFSSFIFNDGDPTSNTSGGTFTVTGTLINITVTTSIGSGSKVIVDGTERNAPYSTQWYATTSHTISVDSEQSGGTGTKYLYNSWAHGGSQTQTVTPTTATTYTANLDTKHYLTVNSVDNHDDPQGEGWYDEGTSANFSVTTPADESGGTRYRFTNWSGDHTGSSASASITMSSAKTVTANWQEQHFLTTSENPDAGGDITPAPGGDWYDDGTSAQVNATVNPGYEWAGWSGALSDTTRPGNITMNSPKSVTANFGKQVQITIQTDPTGKEFKVDDTIYTSAQTFTWVENSQHTLAIVTSPQAGTAGTQYVYSSWSDGGNQSHSYTVPGSNQTVTANFTTQYYLTVTSVRDNPQGEAWYNAGSTANFSVTTPADESGGTRYVFDQWSGDSNAGTAAASIEMNSPKEVVAGWITQHYLTVNSARDNPQGQGWYDEGTSANFSVTTPADESGGTRYRFVDWTGDKTSSNASENITMSGPKTVTANWQEQHFLTTSENPDAGGDITPAPGGDWYDDGTSAQVNATENSGYVWEGWTGDLSGTTRPKNITMNSPKSVTANFGKQVQITIQTDPDGREFKVDGTIYTSTQVFTWIENSQHTLEIVTTPQAGTAGTQYVYSSWSDGGNQSHSYTAPGTNQTVTANFFTQYYLTVTSARDNPQGENWYNAGTTANFSVTSPADESNGTRYVFDQWSGDSNASTAAASIQMNSPKEVVAGWITQYYLTVNSDHDDPQGQGWYNAGVNAGFSVTTPADEANRTRYIFTHWDGSKNSTNASENITMDAPKEVTAHWQTQYYLRTAENPDYGGDVDPAPPGEWYDSGTAATLTATPSGNYEWLGWSGSLSGKTNPAQITMNEPKSVTANFGGEEVTTPDTPEGPSTGYTKQSLTYTTEGAVSSFGHAVEYKFDWGDGSESSWGAATRNHEYSSKGNYTIKARARCATDTEVISSWSNGKTVQIYIFTLTTSTTPEGAGSINRNPNKTGYNYNEVVELTAIPSSGSSLFDHWTGSLTGNENPKNLTMNSDKNVIAHFVLETVSIPNKPSGPSEADAGQDIEFNVNGSQSNFGHNVEYQLDFGNGVQSVWFVGTIVYFYENRGTFQVQARARCADHTEILSDWSDNMDITIKGLILTAKTNPEAAGYVEVNPDKNEYDHKEIVQIHAIANDDAYQFESWDGVGSHWTVNPRDLVMHRSREVIANFVTETVSTPDVPTGPVQGTTEEILTFQTGDAVSSFGHDVEYQFDWGGDSLSVWGDSLQSHTYTTHGSKQVKARARCKDHNQIVSDWSDVYMVVISDFTLSITIDREGTGRVTKNPDKAKYAENEAVELIPEAEPYYLFDHWSGDLTGNDNPATIIMNSDKDITAHFVQTSEIVSKPTFLNGPDSGIMGSFLQYSTGGSVSNLGNNVEYQYNWGDNTFSEWGSGTRNHNYFVSGVMQVKSRARSKENTSVVSEWSEIKPVTISGHKLSVTVDPNNSGKVEKNPNLDEYADSSIVQLKAVPDSGFGFVEWSGDIVGNNNPVTFLITENKIITAHFEEIDETVSPPDQPVGLKNAIIGQQINFTVSGSINSLGLEVEYQFKWGDNSLSTWNSGSASHIYFIADTFMVKARARSKEHQEILSDWSEVLPVVVIGLELTVTVEPVGSGLIAQNPNKLVYAYLDTVEMWPVGTNGYSFDHWSGDLSGENSPGRIIMNSNKNITAHFETVLETVSTPDAPEGPSEGYRKQALTYKAKGAVTSLGSAVEYQFDWGDGNMSSWGDSIRTNKFSRSGEFLIRCRARSKVSITSVSDWSDTLGTVITGCKLVIILDPENSGEVHKDPNQVDYDYGTMVKLTAVNYTNFDFVQWNDDSSDTTEVKIVVMNEDRELKAWFESTVNVEENFAPIPGEFALKQNYPNPFNPETKIEYQLAKECEVQITVFNINGQQIFNLVNENQVAGFHSIVWNAMDQNGFKVPSGIYLYQIRTKFFTSVKKMLLLK